jgi:hypothetical protein
MVPDSGDWNYEENMKYRYVVRLADTTEIKNAKKYCAENNLKHEFEDKKHVFSYTDFYFTSKKTASLLQGKFNALPFYGSEDLKGMVSIL